MKLEIWFEFASTYSYLTVSRAEPLLRAAGVTFEWRPFLLGPIFRDRGLETSPFVIDPLRGGYMWRDMARRATRFDLPFERPPIFPMNGLHAARIMTAALGTGWCGAFARSVFTAQFARGEDISDTEVLGGALAASGVEPTPWLEAAGSEATKTALRAATDEARDRGVFGAPSLLVGNELFWGDDRLEDAIDWALAAG
ncbi:MAG: 2-hydroxychromene-2-carboxylate isomerase [Pseudomonadota bacterium]